MTEKPMQAEYWNGLGGDRWVKNREHLDRAIAAFGERALEQLAVRPGESVLEVGCGAGTTTLELASAVGPAGRVHGVDVSEALLAVARERSAHLPHVDFTLADAAEHRFEDEFDLLFSRFGVMFFDAPREAFRNLLSALRPGGHMGFVCWQDQAANAWSLEPLKCVLPYLEEAPPAPIPHAPGPFAFADPDYTEQELSAAGFREIEIRDLSLDVVLGQGGVQGALDFSMQVGPASRLTEGLEQAAMEGIQDNLRALFSGALKEDVVALPGAAWLVSARR